MADKNKYNSLLSLYGIEIPVVEYDKRVIIEIHNNHERYPHLYEAIERDFSGFITNYDYWTQYHDDCNNDFYFATSGRKLRIDMSDFFSYIETVLCYSHVACSNQIYDDIIPELTEAYSRVILPLCYKNISSIKIGINYINDPKYKTKSTYQPWERYDEIEIRQKTIKTSSVLDCYSNLVHHRQYLGTENPLNDLRPIITTIDPKMQLKEFESVTLPDDRNRYCYYFLALETWCGIKLMLRSDNRKSFLPILYAVLPWLSEEQRMIPTVQRIEELYKTN